MLRLGAGQLGVAQLHQLPQVHYGDGVAHVLHRRQVVGYKDVGDAPLVLDVFQQVQHLGANGNVQRRYRLVQHDEVGVQRQGAGHADALALPAAEFVRELRLHPGWQADGAQRLRYPLLAVSPADAMHLQRLADDVAHPHPGIQRPVGVLQHGLDVPAVVSRILGRHIRQGCAPVQYLPGTGIEELQYEVGHGALAAARLPHQREGLALVDDERNVVNGPDHPGGAAVQQPRLDDEMLDGVAGLDDYVACCGVGLHIYSELSALARRLCGNFQGPGQNIASPVGGDHHFPHPDVTPPASTASFGDCGG